MAHSSRTPVIHQEEIPVMSNEAKPEKILIKNTTDGSAALTINSQLCRLCLREEPDMWSLFSVLTFEDNSTLDVVQAFQRLTGECTEQIEDPKLPKQICKSCVDLLVHAYTFQQKYEKSYQTLMEFLLKEVEDDKKVDFSHETGFDDAETSTYQDVDCKKEVEEDNQTSEIPDIDNNETIHNETIHNGSKVKGNKDELLHITLPVAPEKIVFNNRDPNTGNILHRCPICHKRFVALELKQHCRSHETLKKYFNAAPKFNKKIKFFAKPRTKNVCLFYRDSISHICPFCDEEFDGEQFKEHVKQHRLEGNFRCNICNRIFLGKNHLKMHQLSHKREAPYKCQDCGKEFFQQKNLDFHRLMHTASGNLPFKCKYCPKAFPNPEHLKRHTFTHEKSISYQEYYNRSSKTYISCKQCFQKFRSEEELNEHTCRVCCAKCHKIFANKKEFSVHVCKYKLRAAECQPCGKVFQLASSFKTHKYRCSSRTLCYVCGKNVTNIKQHLQCHYPQKRTCFTCAHCGKQFRFRVSLTRHISDVHLNIVSFRCQFCSKGFKSKWNLTVHERIHLGVKDHICNVCGKRFLEKSYLKKHFRVHLRRDDLYGLHETDYIE